MIHPVLSPTSAQATSFAQQTATLQSRILATNDTLTLSATQPSFGKQSGRSWLPKLPNLNPFVKGSRWGSPRRYATPLLLGWALTGAPGCAIQKEERNGQANRFSRFVDQIGYVLSKDKAFPKDPEHLSAAANEIQYMWQQAVAASQLPSGTLANPVTNRERPESPLITALPNKKNTAGAAVLDMTPPYTVSVSGGPVNVKGEVGDPFDGVVALTTTDKTTGETNTKYLQVPGSAAEQKQQQVAQAKQDSVMARGIKLAREKARYVQAALEKAGFTPDDDSERFWHVRDSIEQAYFEQQQPKKEE